MRKSLRSPAGNTFKRFTRWASAGHLSYKNRESPRAQRTFFQMRALSRRARAPWATSSRPTLVGSGGSGLERKGDGFRFARADGDHLVLRTEGFVPSRYGVGPGRHILDGERAVFAGDLIVRIIEHGDVGLHPGMDVALHRDGDLGAREALHDRRRSRRLRFVPFAIVFGDGVNIVRGHIGIDHRKRLAGLQDRK